MRVPLAAKPLARLALLVSLSCGVAVGAHAGGDLGLCSNLPPSVCDGRCGLWTCDDGAGHTGQINCPPCPCTLQSCQAGECGSKPDGCGGTLDCGACCTPRTCGAGDCGTIPDSCGGTLDCGACPYCGDQECNEHCSTCAQDCPPCTPGTGGSLGLCSSLPRDENVCDGRCGLWTCDDGAGHAGQINCPPCPCTLQSCQAGECGSKPDGCGGTLDCGCCPSSCGADACGTIPDGCGGTLDCGACPYCGDQECNEHCSTCAQDCPPCTPGTGGSLGLCSSLPRDENVCDGRCGLWTCDDGAGHTGQIGCPPCPPPCTPRSCQAGECGFQPDGCGGTLDCGCCPDDDCETIPPGTRDRNYHIFYYPWYGPDLHWQQGGHEPPDDIGSNFYPVLGAYDSADQDVIDEHMRQIASTGVGVIVVSWWGRDSYEDQITPALLDAATKQDLKVAWHIETYWVPKQEQATGPILLANDPLDTSQVAADIQYINERYGNHAAFYKHDGKGVFYVFESHKAGRVADWSPLSEVKDSIILAQTLSEPYPQPHFGGAYNYDAMDSGSAWADAVRKCLPRSCYLSLSVGPGYNDRRAVPERTNPVQDRHNGDFYVKKFTMAKLASPTWISITSFNEWHEGSQIEPASSDPPRVEGEPYGTYEGAYDKTEEDAEEAYIVQTRELVRGGHPLSVHSLGSGDGDVTASRGDLDCGATCVATYGAGSSVTLTAQAASGSTFAGWGGPCSGTGPCTVTMTGAVTVSATFTSSYVLTVTKGGTGSGTVTSTLAGIDCGGVCAATYAGGTLVSLTATPTNAHSTFSGWSGACSGTGPCTVTMDAAKTVAAAFAAANRPPTVSVAVSRTTCHPTPSTPCTATCTASASDPEADPLAYAWAGCAAGTGSSATCTVPDLTTRSCTVTVTDSYAATASGGASVTGVNSPPSCIVNSGAPYDAWNLAWTGQIDLSIQDADGDSIPACTSLYSDAGHRLGIGSYQRCQASPSRIQFRPSCKNMPTYANVVVVVNDGWTDASCAMLTYCYE